MSQNTEIKVVQNRNVLFSVVYMELPDYQAKAALADSLTSGSTSLSTSSVLRAASWFKLAAGAPGIDLNSLSSLSPFLKSFPAGNLT